MEFLDKEGIIRKYILDIDFKNDDWSVKKIREDLKFKLMEDPGVTVSYVKEPVLNETTGEVERIEKIEKITVVFSDGSNKFQKVDFMIEA